MPITEQQREERRSFIGSSDAPAIAGVDPWKSPFAVYLEKVYGTVDLPLKDDDPRARGNRWESYLLDWAEEKLGLKIERNVRVLHEDGLNAANLDGRAISGGRRIGFEAKVTVMSSEFGKEGSDEIPDRVLVQASHQIYVDNLDLVYVPVLLSRFDRPREELFVVEPDEDLIAAVISRNRRFWEEHVVPRIPPPDEGPPAIDTIRSLKREPNKTVELDPGLVRRWERAKRWKKKAEAFEKRMKEKVLASLGNAEAGDFGDSGRIVTYFEHAVSGYTVPPSTSRSALIVKRKKPQGD